MGVRLIDVSVKRESTVIAKNVTVTQTVSPHQPHLQIMIPLILKHHAAQ